ncbi:MAG TPA: Maf family protein, partial [Caulobacteraceae bacterium]|nr:Maf family protein [Caulobacteraceae bacterium]
MTQLVLASQSRVRAKLLEAAGVVFTTAVSGVDEDAIKSQLAGAPPLEIASTLADAKAVRVSDAQPTALVIGADQTLELDGRLFDKPANLAHARVRLTVLRGRVHRLHSAVALALRGEVIWRETVTSSLTMRAFSDAFLEDYLQRNGEMVLGSVGGYALEGDGVQLFDHIEGDYFSILGLPLLGL